MAITTAPKPLVHSWSSINDFENCGYRFYLTRVTKEVKEPQTKALADGNDFHTSIEKAILGEAPLPKRFAHVQPVVSLVKSVPGRKLVEHKFGLDRNWRPTAFFGNDVWIRGKWDLGVVGSKVGVNLDWKTGKIKKDSAQLALFALSMFAEFPYLEAVRTGYVHLGDEKGIIPETFKPEDIPEWKETFAHRIFQIEDANKRNKWSKRPSGLCKEHCPVGRARCEYCGS